MIEPNIPPIKDTMYLVKEVTTGMNIASFVGYVYAHQGVLPDQLAEKFGVGTRTVRNYIAKANEALHGVAVIELERGSGYSVCVDCQQGFTDFLQATDATCACLSCKTPDERVDYLLNDLLMRSDWIKLQDLSKALYVSKSALSGDLKRVEERLLPYDLVLERKSHYGIRVVGGELSRRLCMAHTALAAIGTVDKVRRSGSRSQGGGSGRYAVDDLFQALGFGDGRELLSLIAACVNEAIDRWGFVINAAAFQNLLVHIAIALLRIAEDCYVPMAEEHLQRIEGTSEWNAAEDIARSIAEAVPVQLPREEIAYIAIHIAGKQTVYDESGSEGIVIDDDIWGLVTEMLNRVWDVFRFDFRNDLELKMNLARHLQPLTIRLKYRFKLKNPMLDDIKARYPLAYSIAIDASSAISERYDASLSKDEIGYIALAFELALERSESQAAKKNILIVCASGAGSARLLEYQCRREFGDYVDRIATCDTRGLDRIDFDDFDYVFTTVSLDRTLPVPVRKVTCFLDPLEAEQTRELLRGDALDSVQLDSFLDQRLFFPHLSFATKEETLGFLLDRVSELRSVPDRFNDLVCERERRMPTAFGNRIAMPHPLEVATEETFVCIGLLDTPIDWGVDGEPVQAVFLCAFAFKENDGSRAFFDRMAEVLVDPDAITALTQDQEWGTFTDLLHGNSPVSDRIPPESR